MRAQLNISDLTKRYGSVLALDGIDLAIEHKSVLAILGPNGAGKSTLFGCLLGLIHPTRGRILWQGNAIGDTQRASIGYMPERVALYPSSTVLENGLFFAGLKHQPRTELERQLDRVGLLSVAGRKVRQLSKGMLQRLGLAIALCGQPELLILDEPFNGLDPALLESLQAILREERERGVTLLIPTLTISAIEPLATHVAILLDGMLAVHSPIDALRRRFGPDESLESIYHRIARERNVSGGGAGRGSAADSRHEPKGAGFRKPATWSAPVFWRFSMTFLRRVFGLAAAGASRPWSRLPTPTRHSKAAADSALQDASR